MARVIAQGEGMHVDFKRALEWDGSTGVLVGQSIELDKQRVTKRRR